MHKTSEGENSSACQDEETLSCDGETRGLCERNSRGNQNRGSSSGLRYGAARRRYGKRCGRRGRCEKRDRQRNGVRYSERGEQ